MYFYAIKDINRDGKVDMITSWDVGDRFGEEYLWIFGWDGHTGFLENAYDDENQSVIAAQQGGFELEDINGDGIMEIIGEQDSVQFTYETDEGATKKVMNTIEERYNVYSWNGQLYGKRPDTPPYPANGIVPRNKVNVDVHASVTQAETGLDFRYIIHSKRTSLQDIDQIVLLPVSDSLNGVSARPGWQFYPNDGIIDWVIGWGPSDLIRPGESDSNFVYQTRALPVICNYYIRGHNGVWGQQRRKYGIKTF